MSMSTPVDLIGHSWGGFVALRLTMDHPEIVRSVSLFEPIISSLSQDHELFAAEMQNMDEVARQIEIGDRAMAARLFMRVWGDGRPWADLPEALRDACTHGIAHVVASQPALMLDSTNSMQPQALANISVPVTVIDGERSPDLAHAIQDTLASRIPGATRVTIAGAGHMGPISHAADVAAAIRENLARAAG
mgnify:CR=1 FL=1